MRVHEASGFYAAWFSARMLIESMNRERQGWPSVNQQDSSVCVPSAYGPYRNETLSRDVLAIQIELLQLFAFDRCVDATARYGAIKRRMPV
jgi:hypothetical protein